MSLAIGFIVLVIFLSILIFYLIVTVRDVARILDKVESVTDKVHTAVVGPLKAVDYIVEKITPYIQAVLEKKLRDKKRK